MTYNTTFFINSVTNANVLGNGSDGGQVKKSNEVDKKEKDQTQINESDLNNKKTGCKRIIQSDTEIWEINFYKYIRSVYSHNMIYLVGSILEDHQKQIILGLCIITIAGGFLYLMCQPHQVISK